MTDLTILLVGLFAFVMAIVGVVLTVLEFKRNVFAMRTRVVRDRNVRTTDSAREHAS